MPLSRRQTIPTFVFGYAPYVNFSYDHLFSFQHCSFSTTFKIVAPVSYFEPMILIRRPQKRDMKLGMFVDYVRQ